MAKYLIEYNRVGCIGASSCAAVAPQFWIMKDDGKADLLNGKQIDENNWTFEVEEKDLELVKESAVVCPVKVIRIKNLDTGEYLV